MRFKQRMCHRGGWRTQWAEGPSKELVDTGNDSLVTQELGEENEEKGEGSSDQNGISVTLRSVCGREAGLDSNPGSNYLPQVSLPPLPVRSPGSFSLQEGVRKPHLVRAKWEDVSKDKAQGGCISKRPTCN